MFVFQANPFGPIVTVYDNSALFIHIMSDLQIILLVFCFFKSVDWLLLCLFVLNAVLFCVCVANFGEQQPLQCLDSIRLVGRLGCDVIPISVFRGT